MRTLPIALAIALTACATTAPPRPPSPTLAAETSPGCYASGRLNLPAPENTIGCKIARWLGVPKTPMGPESGDNWYLATKGLFR